MKIAGVALTYNDGYKLSEWRKHYEIFKNQLDLFVIVDNNSCEEYKRQLKNTFPEAVIIERTSNGGCTGAYNDGIKYIMDNTDADSILIIANDIKPTPNCIHAMYEYLMSDNQLGIVSSAILFKDSTKIDNYGHTMDGIYVKRCNAGDDISTIIEKSKYTDLVPGGFTLAKRSFYEKVGLQDYRLFMYCDELDSTYKAQKNGFKIGVIANEYAWHWHINNPHLGKRSSSSRYLISRNRVYLTRKYLSKTATLAQLFRNGVITTCMYIVKYLRTMDKGYIKDARYTFMGAIHGYVGIMDKKKYITFD